MSSNDFIRKDVEPVIDTAVINSGGATGEFERDEVNSIYASFAERFVVSLIVSYSPDQLEIADTRENSELGMLMSAKGALDLTQDGGSDGTHWYVYDRMTETGRFLEQGDFESQEIP